MARALPHTPQALLKVSGVGEHKLAQYGEQFLVAIRAYCVEHGLTERESPVRPGRERIQAGDARRTEVGKYFASGQTVEELQRLYGVKAETIIQHLADYQREGNYVDAARLLPYCQLPPSEHARVLRLFDELGSAALRPVFDALDEQVPFNDLRLLRIYYLSLKSPERQGEL